MSRIVVKVGSSSLTSATGHLDPVRVAAIVDAISHANSRGDEVILVSSGAIAAGIGPLVIVFPQGTTRSTRFCFPKDTGLAANVKV